MVHLANFTHVGGGGGGLKQYKHRNMVGQGQVICSDSEFRMLELANL